MNASKIVVTYFEDDPDIRTIVELAMDLEPDIDLQACAPTTAFIDQLEQRQPHLVLLDVMMPGIDGLSIARAMRSHRPLMHIPFAFMTAKALPLERQQLQAMGACGVIAKPFDPLRLAGEIRALLRSVA